jgi:hypothetical protein
LTWVIFCAIIIWLTINFLSKDTMAIQYADEGKIAFESGQITTVRIGQRSTDKSEQLVTLAIQQTLEVAITSDGAPLRFAYTVDRQDRELCIIIPDVAYSATVNDNILEGSSDNSYVTQTIKGDRNSAIGKHTGGTIIANHIGDLIL